MASVSGGLPILIEPYTLSKLIARLLDPLPAVADVQRRRVDNKGILKFWELHALGYL